MDLDPIESGDLHGLARLFVEVFGAPPWNEQWTVAAAQTRLTEIVQTPGSFGLVARSEGADIAFVLGCTETYNDGKGFFVKEMCVAPSRQRLGVGTALLGELERGSRPTGSGRSTS